MQLPYSNLRMEHWNPGASKPLILPIHVICNTSDDEIYGNIKKNSSLQKKWIKVEPEHDVVAVLCGSGPSLVDFIEEIREKQKQGCKVFAMNGAATFLHKHGIFPDYQVIIDAREQTADLIGPAKEHLFASQVHPECFRRKPEARLWHLQIGNIEREFPDYENAYVLIGGAASVGNTATCLAFAMGYRNLQIYGYDSSHREGKGHAFHQKMNEGDPCCHVTFNGKEFICSFTMKLQAEKFQETSKALISSGCKMEVHGDGLLPEMFRHPEVVMTEYEKYKKMWEMKEYREMSPGELCAELFVSVVNPEDHHRIIDYGCGTGRGSLKLRQLTSCEIVQVDFAENCRDGNSKDFIFIQCDMTKEIPVTGNYGFCTDVMEHIETDKVENVIRNIVNSSPEVFFQISTIPDEMGALIGQPLHLTVRPHEWWKETFNKLGYEVAYEEKRDIASIFFIKSRNALQEKKWTP